MSRVSAYNFAIFANDVYKPNTANLPSGWYQYISSDAAGLIGGDAYFGMSYINPSLSQYLIAHRGTASLGNLWSDIEIAIGDEIEAYQRNALPFVRFVQSNLTASGYSLAGITGHSLGAAYAVLSAKELNVPATVFELPAPAGFSSSSLVTIYNAAPNGIDSFVSPGQNVVRLYPDISLAQASLANLPPSGIVAGDYFSFTLQQHSMANLLAQFNKVTGEARIFSIESNWPGSLDSGYSNFISYDQNPYFLRDTLYSNWISDILEGLYFSSKSFDQYIATKMPLLTPPGVSSTGKTIIGDDSGNDFWGGTTYSDIYHGGLGDDTYRLFGGNDSIIDTGGANQYILYSPQSGKASVSDANPSEARIISDGAVIAGDALAITRYVTPAGLRAAAQKYLRGASHSRELQSGTDDGYLLLDPLNGRAFLAKNGNDGSLNIGSSFGDIDSGNAVSLQNFASGDFSINYSGDYIIQPRIYNLDSRIVNCDGMPFFCPVIGGAVKLLDNSVAFIANYRAGKDDNDFVSNPTMYIVKESGEYTAFAPELAPEHDELLLSAASGHFLLMYDYHSYRIYNNAGRLVCSPDVPPNSWYSSDIILGDFVLVNANNTYYTNSSQVEISSIDLYLVSTGCSVRRLHLFSVPNYEFIDSITVSNQLAIVSGTPHDVATSIIPSKVRFFSLEDFAITSQYNLPFFSGSGIVSIMNRAGTLLVAGVTTDGHGQYYQYYHQLAIINSATGVTYLSELMSRSSWVPLAGYPAGDNAFMIFGASPKNVYPYFEYLTARVYNQKGEYQLLDISEFSLAANDQSWPGILSQNPLGTNGTLFFITSSEGSTLKIGFADYKFTTSIQPDVFVGGSGAGNIIDCSNSSAPTCYAVSQGGNGDILIARIDQSAILIGGNSGSQTFKILPSIARRLKAAVDHEDNGKKHALSAGLDSDISYWPEDDDSLMSKITKHVARLISSVKSLLGYQEQLYSERDGLTSSDLLEIWGMENGDEIDLSEVLHGENPEINNYGNRTTINISGYPSVQVMHASGSVPFNLTIHGGVVMPTFLPAPSPSFAPDTPGAGSDGLTSGATAGIAIAVLSIAGITVATYKYGKSVVSAVRKWWNKSPQDEAHQSGGEAVTVLNPINPLHHEDGIELVGVPEHSLSE